MTISTPVVNAGNTYINGLNLVYASTTSIVVNPGLCRNSTNINDISVGLPLNVAATQTGTEPVAAGTGAVTISTAVTGVGGLDAGVIANSTFYAVYAIGDSYGLNPGSALISANLTAPFLPSGYDMYFRIGYVKTDGSAHILPFRQDGISLDRWMWYDDPIPTSVTDGSSGSYAPVDATAGLPTDVPTIVRWYILFTPTDAGNSITLAPGTSSSVAGYASQSGSVAGVTEVLQLYCPTDLPTTTAIQYHVTGSSTAIDVQAYLDQLSI